MGVWILQGAASLCLQMTPAHDPKPGEWSPSARQGKLIKSFEGEMEMGLVNGWGSETLYDTKGNLLGTYVGNFENGDYNRW